MKVNVILNGVTINAELTPEEEIRLENEFSKENYPCENCEKISEKDAYAAETERQSIILKEKKSMLETFIRVWDDINHQGEELSVEELAELTDRYMKEIFNDENWLFTEEHFVAILEGGFESCLEDLREEIINERAKVYGVAFRVTYDGYVYVKAHSEEDAIEYVENMEEYQLSDFVNYDDMIDCDVLQEANVEDGYEEKGYGFEDAT